MKPVSLVSVQGRYIHISDAVLYKSWISEREHINKQRHKDITFIPNKQLQNMHEGIYGSRETNAYQ